MSEDEWDDYEPEWEIPSEAEPEPRYEPEFEGPSENVPESDSEPEWEGNPELEPEEARVDDYVERAKHEILDTILQQRLVTDREIKVRLERAFFPWVVERAVDKLREEGIVRRVGDKGRKLKGAPESFYTLSEIEWTSCLHTSGEG